MATTTTSPQNSARTVAGLIGFAVAFSLIGNEINVATGNKPDKLGSGLSKGVTIILGGFIAAALLTAATGAGEAGRKLGVGLATVTAVSSALVYGGPVWQGLNNVLGSKGGSGAGTTPTGNTAATTATAATQPTTGTATVAALANVA